MELLTAHEAFARRKDRSIMDVSAKYKEADCWPAAATAGVWLSGYLDDAVSDGDLDEALEHFAYLFREGIVTDDKWKETIEEVIDEVLQWGAEREAAGAVNN